MVDAPMARPVIAVAFILCALSVSFGQFAQHSDAPSTAPPKPNRTQLAAATKAYLRDSAEFPLEVQLSLLVTDSSGRTIKKDHARGQYDFHGYNLKSETANANVKISTNGIFHSAKGMIPTFLNGFLASVMPASILSSNNGEPMPVDISESSADGETFVARVSPASKCTEFKWSAKDSVPQVCAAAQFTVRKDDFTLRHFSFQAAGLPLATEVKPLGACHILRYYGEVDFQKVTLQDDPKPFLVPRLAVVTIETDKGKIVMTDEFAPRK